MKTIYLAFVLLIFGGVILMSNRNIEENKYTEYIVIEACGTNNGLARLRENVNFQIKEGWQPMGGIELYESYTTCYYQAMVR